MAASSLLTPAILHQTAASTIDLWNADGNVDDGSVSGSEEEDHEPPWDPDFEFLEYVTRQAAEDHEKRMMSIDQGWKTCASIEYRIDSCRVR
jgi:hypothetical protein